MATAKFYFPTKISATTTLTLSRVDWYPSSRPVQRVQSRRFTPGGTPIVYSLGLTHRFINIITRHLSTADEVLLTDFIRQTTSWASSTFEYEDPQGNVFLNCRFWLDEYDFAQTSTGRFAEDLLLTTDGLIIAFEEPLDATADITNSITEASALTNTLWCGLGNGKLFKNSGFTSTLLDSISIVSIDNLPTGIGWDGVDTIWCGVQAGKFYKNSGFTSTLLDSIDISAIDNNILGINWDGSDTIWSGTQADKLYKNSGFTSELINSIDVSGIDAGPNGIGFDGTDTLWCGAGTSKLFKNSGFTSTLLDSIDVSAVETQPSGICWNSPNTIWCGFTDDKLYKSSGFTSTILDSIDISAVDNTINGVTQGFIQL